MGIEVPVLDDRRFQDIVDEAKRRIPDLFPEWTNHNISDPGVALIELFAWMTEMTLFRLNELPDRAMAALLDGIGFRTFPARAATTDLTFFVTGTVGRDEPVRIPAGTPVGTETGADGQVIFETDEELLLTAPDPTGIVVQTGPGRYERRSGAPGATPRIDGAPLVCFVGLADAVEKWQAKAATLHPTQRRHWRPRGRFPGDTVNFGFAVPLPNALIRVEVTVDQEGLGIDPNRPPVVWEASTAAGWARCTVARDTTGGLNRTGSLDVQLPVGHAAQRGEIDDTSTAWLRARVDSSAFPMFHTSPALTSISFATVGGVVGARHAELQPPEQLGRSTGRPGQRFRLRNTPVLDLPPLGPVTVGGEPWYRRDDFTNVGPDDSVYTLDPSTGEIAFGPAVRLPDGTIRQFGAVPPRDALIVSPAYRVGGGVRGNVPVGTLRTLRKTVNRVDSVVNREAATGGVEAETMDEALDRAPATVLAGDRAVTLDDYVRIATDAARDVHLVAARGPGERGGPVRVLVVPRVTVHPSVQRLDDYELEPALCARLTEHLDERRLIGQRFEISTPYYQGVSVVAKVRCARTLPDGDGSSSNADDERVVTDRVIEELYRFINPITGGEHGRGLGFDAELTEQLLIDRVMSVQGVRAVVELALFEADARMRRRVGDSIQRISVPSDTLFMSVNHWVGVERARP